MCSSSSIIFGPIMDNYHQGDLTDIIRATATTTGGGGGEAALGTTTCSSDQFLPPPPHHQAFNFSSLMEDPRTIITQQQGFGDPFSNMRDPFLQDLDFPPNTNTNYFPPPPPSSSLVLHHHDNNAIFSNNIIQISPPPNNANLPVSPPSPAPGIKSVVNNNNSRECLVDNAAGVQISSPRNPPLKRRKSQAKKVVCIPAPAAANSRPSSGEVVPSDLWAWRKYGQKPIKGSPYPRGYYRCSSSKGCSARKQVERSRTDPNMLVITYTSEHNHPWPTQRNALAGSTRSQPSSKNNNNAASSKNNNSEASLSQAQKPKEEDNKSSDMMTSKIVKEEMEDTVLEKHDVDQLETELELELELENNIIMEDNHDNINNNGEFSDGVLPYKPSMVECNNNQSDQDFFAELGEIEADPLNDLLFTHQHFNQQQHQRESKALDPFHLFDWSGDHNNINTSSFQEPPKRSGL
ncbi:putative WRKY transcription factor 14 [Senna tora]|uniref:Putative WRKY transcription factor 14 n=1 Tax=Senna tora TaxID=362788 RepID=A0A834SK38_9FABA|nr:putative WRKY transcription factor 14 [Senna tora]